MIKIKKKWSGWAVVLLFTFIFTSQLKAATLSVGSTSGSPGDKDVSIPVELRSTPGEKVCGFNFDLNFDTSKLLFKEVSLGPVAKAAGKSLLYSQPDSSIVRVLVTAINRNVIENGTVLNFYFDIMNSAAEGKAALAITDPFITDPKAHLLPVTIENGEIVIHTTHSTTSTPATIPTTTSSTSTTTPYPPPGSSTTTTASDTPSTTTVKTTTSINPDSSSSTTSQSQLWPLFYDTMWGNKREINLVLLRAFRDEILVNTEVGRKYTSILYGNSLEVAELLLENPSLTAKTREVIDELLPRIVLLTTKGKAAITKDKINKVESLLDHFEAKASPKLASAIKKVRKDISERKALKKLGIKIVE